MGRTSTQSKNKWNKENYEQVKFVVRKGEREKIKTYADSKGMSVNALLTQLLEIEMAKG